MRIELRDTLRRRVGRVDVDTARRPTRVTSEGDEPREVFLDWDRAVDDAGHLRRCVACGCHDLFRAKAFPQVTGLVVVLAFAGATLGALGYGGNTAIGLGMIVVLAVDVAILLLARQRLVCHRCRTSYHELPIARYHRSWDRAIAEQHAIARVAATAAGPKSRLGRLLHWMASWRLFPWPPKPRSMA